jgi:hypothetical protein
MTLCIISPGSAKHPWVEYDKVTKRLSDDTYQVISYVDSQNAFGALVRTYYVALVRMNSQDPAVPGSIISLKTGPSWESLKEGNGI